MSDDASEANSNSDTAGDTENADDTSGADGHSGVAGQMLRLAAIDTEADQLSVQRERLAEREALAARSQQMTEWEQRRAAIANRLDELSTVIDDAEKRNAELGADRARLEAQMKTVIAPREAEALTHEIETINEQRDELDDAELLALEEQARLDDERAAHLELEDSLRSALSYADEALSRACADIDGQLDRLAADRIVAVEGLDAAVLAKYDRVRASVGVAVAELKGTRCEGCHLDLSAAEVDTAKDEAADTGYTDCPQCGRLLVV